MISPGGAEKGPVTVAAVSMLQADEYRKEVFRTCLQEQKIFIFALAIALSLEGKFEFAENQKRAFAIGYPGPDERKGGSP